MKLLIAHQSVRETRALGADARECANDESDDFLSPEDAMKAFREQRTRDVLREACAADVRGVL